MNYLHDEPLTNEASILEAALCHLERGEPKFVDPISAWLGENGSRKTIAILRQAAAGFGGVSTSGKNVQRAVEQIEHRLGPLEEGWLTLAQTDTSGGLSVAAPDKIGGISLSDSETSP